LGTLLLSASPLAVGVDLPAAQRPSLYIDRQLPDAQMLQQAAAQQPGHLHLFSHGRPGELLIDGQWQNAQQIAEWARAQGWQNADKPLAIYGCNFAKGETGRAAVSYLQTALGVPVAASDDLTGLNGDWDLEVGSQSLADSSLTQRLENYPHSLQCTGPAGDCDGDGVLDGVDVDDDNDGILDDDEVRDYQYDFSSFETRFVDTVEPPQVLNEALNGETVTSLTISHPYLVAGDQNMRVENRFGINNFNFNTNGVCSPGDTIGVDFTFASPKAITFSAVSEVSRMTEWDTFCLSPASSVSASFQ
jgi:hypothetical protein